MSGQSQADIERDVALMKRMLPRKCGMGVTWFDAVAGDREIIYKYRLELDRNVIESRRRTMPEAFRKQWAMLARLAGNDIRFRFDFHDRHGNFVFSETFGGDPPNRPANAVANNAKQTL